MAEIGTERLIMRGWRESDLAPWAAMNADPEVRRYLGPLLTFEQASAWVLNFQDDLDRYGFGFWALAPAGVGRRTQDLHLNRGHAHRGTRTAWLV
jgi:RimJ/RimL family protein N-acetyltransferase